MTSKKRLEEYLLALSTLSLSVMQEIAKTVSETEQEVEDEEDFRTLVSLMLASSSRLKRQFQRDIEQFLKEWDVAGIVRRCSDDIGYPVKDLDRTVETIEKGLKAMPAGATRRMSEIVNEISNRTGIKHEAVETALEHFAEKNIPAVQYEDGKTVSVEAYAKTAINTGLHNAQLEADAEDRIRRKSFLVYAAPRREACGKCIPWLGVVMFDDLHYTGEIPKEYAKYPLLSEAVKKGFLHPNCRDTIREYDPLTTDVERPTKEEQEKILERYKREQYINYAKRNIRKYKILESADSEKYGPLRKRWEERLKEAEQ